MHVPEGYLILIVVFLYCNNLTFSVCLSKGNSGLGKSTMVNTLFKSQVSRRSAGWSRDDKIPKTVEVKAVSHGEKREGESERKRERDINSLICFYSKKLRVFVQPHIHFPRVALAAAK